MNETAMETETVTSGRLSTYTEAMGEYICDQLAIGRSLRSICREEQTPELTTVIRWLLKNDVFRLQYEAARDIQADSLADELVDIADDGTNDWMEKHGKDSPGWVANGEHVQRSRLRVDTRKWAASKLKPKKYGDRTNHTSDDGSMSPVAAPGLDVSKLSLSALAEIVALANEAEKGKPDG